MGLSLKDIGPQQQQLLFSGSIHSPSKPSPSNFLVDLKAFIAITIAASAGVVVFLCFFYFNTIPAGPLVRPGAPHVLVRAAPAAGAGAFSPKISKVEENATTEVGVATAADVDADGKEAIAEISRASDVCDLAKGSWVRDESYPLYRPKSCPFIDEGFSCQENGRPDDGYTKWRWQPFGCDMPRFNATKMLERLRGNRVAFVGDSIGRNQWESLLCMLTEAVTNKSRVYEENGEAISKRTSILSFRFEDYNFTLEYYRSPFLVPQGHPPPDSPPQVKTSLKIDTMDWTSPSWHHAHILLFNAAHWWTYEKTLREGAYFEEEGKVKMGMDVKSAFKRAIRTWAEWVKTEVNSTRTRVFFRSYAPVHFSGGSWKRGGRCHEETEPTSGNNSRSRSSREVENWKNVVVASEVQRLKKDTQVEVEVLNITPLSSLRQDGHPSLYYQGGPEKPPMHRQDCSHWCLPGVPDTWNQLLYAILVDPQKPGPSNSNSINIS